MKSFESMAFHEYFHGEYIMNSLNRVIQVKMNASFGFVSSHIEIFKRRISKFRCQSEGVSSGGNEI